MPPRVAARRAPAGAVIPAPELTAAPIPAALDARTRVEVKTRGVDFSWVADLLTQQQDDIMHRWLEAASAQPFHAGRRERAIANHIPAIIDALFALLRRTAAQVVDGPAPLDEPAVLAAAQAHAKMRMEQGLAAPDIVTEFRLLRQEVGWALRFHVAAAAPASDVLGAEMLLHDALDDAAFLAVLAVDERDAELRRLREALASEQLRLTAVLEQLPAAVLIVDAPSGQVALGPPETKRLSHGRGVPPPAGENPDEWRGFHRDGRRYAPEEWPLARAVQAGEVVTGEEIDYLRDDGTRGTVSVNAAPVRDSAGIVVAGVAIFTDVTERKTLEQEKQAFLTAISHDLRNPLMAIKGFSSILLMEVDAGTSSKEQLIERLRMIDSAADRMGGQLTELQDIAKLRTGKAVELERREVDLVALVQAGAARHQAISPRHTIDVVLTELGPQSLVGEWDRARLDRVLDNLLGNALKFSPRGGRIALTMTREPGGMAVLRVQDEGIGIPADDLPHVFDWFRRASNAVGKIAGTGIGMAAARQIAELHHGTIDVVSEEDHGCTFTLRLPLRASPSTAVD